jgi:polar amino acid transport system substrate-binding protein
MIRFVLLGVALLLPVCARAQAPVLVDKAAVNWGTAATFPPFEFIEDGKPVGFDIDLADALSKQMGLKPAIDGFEFKGLIPALLGKRIDAIISAMYINADREKIVDFVPYMLVGNQLVVRKGNPLKVSDGMGLCGHRIAAPVGTVFETAAKKLDAACTAAGKQGISLLSLAGTTASALALSQDRADAVIVSTATAASLIHSDPAAFETAGVPFDNDTKVGIAVSKDNAGLVTDLTKALRAVVADGTYAGLMKKWGLPAAGSAF